MWVFFQGKNRWEFMYIEECLKSLNLKYILLLATFLFSSLRVEVGQIRLFYHKAIFIWCSIVKKTCSLTDGRLIPGRKNTLCYLRDRWSIKPKIVLLHPAFLSHLKNKSKKSNSAIVLSFNGCQHSYLLATHNEKT